MTAQTLSVAGPIRLHELPAHTKLVALAAFVVAVVATPREAVWAFAAHATLVVCAAAAAHVGPGFVGRRLLVGAPFVLFALSLPLLGGGPRVALGGLAVSVGGLWAAWAIVAKSTIALAASIVVTATTSVPDLLAGLGRLRVPALMTAIAGFMVRYLEVLADEVRRRRIAMASRGYAPRWAWQAGPLTASAGTLFVRSHERGERVYDAMVSRGYRGRMPPTAAGPALPRHWAIALALPACAVAVAIAGVIA